MKLIREIIQRRLEVLKDYGLNNETAKEIWSFYEVYKICLNVLGIPDNDLKKKQLLLKALILKPTDIRYIVKLKDYMSQDNQVVELVLTSLQENEELEEVYEDFYPIDVIGVNIYDR